MKIVLASTSPYRRALLGRLNLPFETRDPGIDESGLVNETPRDKALRLARSKAAAVAGSRPGAIVIGSDQVACNGTREYRKPGNFAVALDQLTSLSGSRLVLHTGIVVIAADGRESAAVEDFEIEFRAFGPAQARRYLEIEKPYDCAASLKSEGLGIVLIRRFIGEDPTALVGLPLIRLVDMLTGLGVPVPADDEPG